MKDWMGSILVCAVIVAVPVWLTYILFSVWQSELAPLVAHGVSVVFFAWLAIMLAKDE